MKKKLKNKSLKILITYLFCASTYTYINVDAMKNDGNEQQLSQINVDAMKNDGNEQQLSQINKINLENSDNKVNYTENSNILNNKDLKSSIITNFENRVKQIKRNFENGIIEDLENKIKKTQKDINSGYIGSTQNYIKELYNILNKSGKCLEEKNIVKDYENKVKELEKSFKNKIIEILSNKITDTQICIHREDYDTAQNYMKQIYNILDKNGKCLEEDIVKKYENKVKELEKNIKDNVISTLNFIVGRIQEEAKLKDTYPRKKLIKEIYNFLNKNGKYLEKNIKKNYENKIKELEKNFKNETIENLEDYIKGTQEEISIGQLANAQISIKSLYHCLYNTCLDKNAITNYKNKAEKLEKSLKQKYIENFEIKIRTAQEMIDKESIDLEDLDYAQECIEDINSKLYEDKKFFLPGKIYEGTDLKKYLEGPIRKNYENKIKILKKNFKNKIIEHLEDKIKDAICEIDAHSFNYALELIDYISQIWEKICEKRGEYFENSTVDNYEYKIHDLKVKMTNEIKEKMDKEIEEAQKAINTNDFSTADISLKNINEYLELAPKTYLTESDKEIYKNKKEEIEENFKKKIIEYIKDEIKKANDKIYFDHFDDAEENIRDIYSFLGYYGRIYLNYKEIDSFEKMIKNLNGNLEKGKSEEREAILRIVDEKIEKIEYYIQENDLNNATISLTDLKKYLNYGKYGETEILIKQLLTPSDIGDINKCINDSDNSIKKRRKEKTINNLKNDYKDAIEKINNQKFEEASDIVTKMISGEKFLLPFDEEIKELYKDVHQLKNVIENKEKYISAKKQLKSIYIEAKNLSVSPVNFEAFKQKVRIMEQELKFNKQYLRNDEIKKYENRIIEFDTIIESHNENHNENIEAHERI